MSWVEDRLIAWRDGIRWSDVLAADDSIDEDASASKLKDEYTEPFEAVDAAQSAEKLYEQPVTFTYYGTSS